MTSDRDPPLTWRQSLFYASIMPLAMLGVLVLFGFISGIIPIPFDYCITKSKGQIQDLAGLDFTMSETDCDSGSAMSVFVAKTGESVKTLLFKFDPVQWVPPPKISVDSQSRTILISLAMTQGTYSRLEAWNGMRVKYDIWKPDDPRLEALRRQACARNGGCSERAPLPRGSGRCARSAGATGACAAP